VSRTRASAKAAGAKFERTIADALAVIDDRIDRRVKRGQNDRGDIGGLRSAHGLRVVVECKDAARVDLAGWYREAVTEMGNDDAQVAVVAHKRRGVGQGMDQWVTMTVRDLTALITGERS
jgi:hypothetical protein